MWNFIPGVSKPKEKQTEQEKKQYYSQYDKNRKRKFSEDWTAKYPWLKDTEKGLQCTVCAEFSTGTDRNKPFVLGAGIYKHDSITKHESSKTHEKCILIAKAKAEPKAVSAAYKIVKTMNAEIMEKLDKLFRNCHAIAVKNKPLTDYLWMCKLDEAKNIELGQTYRNLEYAKKFVSAIAEVELHSVTELVRRCSFLTVIGDGSTDISVKEQEMWFMRTAIEGEIYVRFMGVACTEKANAENIVKSLKSVVSQNLKIEWSEFNSKMVSVACDGASVMLGVKAGVAALLKKEQPCLIPVHCMAHRLELALKDSVKAIKLYQKTVSVLAMGLYYFYHNSPLNRSMLERSFIALKSIKTDVLLVPVRVGGTRWVQHTVNALQNIHGSYRYIMQHLGQLSEPTERVSIDSKSKAVAFMRLLKSKDVLCFMMLLLDVLIPLRRLSLLLQEQSCLIGKQHTELGATIEVIRKYKSSIW